MKELNSISESEFNEAVAMTKMQDKTIQMAKEVMVFNKDPSEVAKKYNVSLQWVTATCDRISANLTNYREVSFKLPSVIANDIIKIANICIGIYKSLTKGGK